MSTLSDTDIKTRVQQGKLIAKGFSPTHVHQACYELRMGDVYYDLSEENRRIELRRGEKVLIKPLHRVVLITREELDIPHDMLARITSKGSLFSVGLAPVSTYADPGFGGQIGIVTQNISDKYIELPQDEPIAKIEFSMLTSTVQQPYRGQHGFQTNIWPIKGHFQKSHKDVRSDPRVESELAEAYKVTPAATVRLMEYLYRRQRLVLYAVALCLATNFAVLSFVGNWLDSVVALLINLLSAAIVGGIAFFQRAPWGK